MPPGANAANPWGNQRSDETVLTGDTLAKVKESALAKVGSDATIVRIETDADGHGAYEAHMLKSDGTPVTVYVDTSFAVAGVEDQPAGGPGGGHRDSRGPAPSDATGTDSSSTTTN